MCRLCETVCPTQAIVITVSTDMFRCMLGFSINCFMCIYCGLCYELCPVGCVDEISLYDFSLCLLVLLLKILSILMLC